MNSLKRKFGKKGMSSDLSSSAAACEASSSIGPAITTQSDPIPAITTKSDPISHLNTTSYSDPANFTDPVPINKVYLLEIHFRDVSFF